mgnify:CR=1 FL=1
MTSGLAAKSTGHGRILSTRCGRMVTERSDAAPFADTVGFRKATIPLVRRASFNPLRFTLAAMAMLSAASRAVAFPPPVSLAIINPGFETDFAAENCFNVSAAPTGWLLYDPTGIYNGGSNSVGTLDTRAGGPHFIDGAPEGEQVGLTFIQASPGAGPMGIRQSLGNVLEQNTTYTLSVQVGDIAAGQGPPPCDVFGFFNLNGFPGYQVQLLAGGVVIAEDNNTLAGVLDEGLFALSTIQVTIGEGHPQAGAQLEIRLINLNMIDTPMNPGIEVDFDDVVLLRGCPNQGDMDESGDVDTADIPDFVDVLLELIGDAEVIERADVNCSGSADGLDVGPFVANLLG